MQNIKWTRRYVEEEKGKKLVESIKENCI